MQTMKPGVPYESVRERMRTWDVLLFHGSDIVSKVIEGVERIVTGSGSFTHAGLVVRVEDMDPNHAVTKQVASSGATLLVLESTGSGKLSDGVPAVTDGRSHLGVQLRDMDLVVTAYDADPATRLAWLPLQDKERPMGDTAALLNNVMDTYLGRFYDASCVDLVAAALPCLRKLRDSTFFYKMRAWIYKHCLCGATPERWLFCSELVARVYQDIGIFPTGIEAANVLPTDFLPNEATARRISAAVCRSPATSAMHAAVATPSFSAPQLYAVSSPLCIVWSPPDTGAAVPSNYGTLDADGDVPWVFSGVVRFTRPQ